MIKISTTDCSESALSQSWKYHQCVDRFGDLKLFITEKYNSGMTQKQIAEFMKISDPTLKSWQDAFEKHGGRYILARSVHDLSF
jgi:hypothetical protein